MTILSAISSSSFRFESLAVDRFALIDARMSHPAHDRDFGLLIAQGDFSPLTKPCREATHTCVIDSRVEPFRNVRKPESARGAANRCRPLFNFANFSVRAHRRDCRRIPKSRQLAVECNIFPRYAEHHARFARSHCYLRQTRDNSARCSLDAAIARSEKTVMSSQIIFAYMRRCECRT